MWQNIHPSKGGEADLEEGECVGRMLWRGENPPLQLALAAGSYWFPRGFGGIRCQGIYGMWGCLPVLCQGIGGSGVVRKKNSCTGKCGAAVGGKYEFVRNERCMEVFL